MESNKDSVKQLFSLFENKDFPGFILVEEAVILTQELNDPRPLEEIAMIFKVKPQSKISFEEFMLWWSMRGDASLRKLMRTQLKLMRLLTKARLAYPDMLPFLKKKPLKDNPDELHKLSLNVGGKVATKTSFRFKLLSGVENLEFATGILNGFEGISPFSPSIVLKFKTDKPQEAKVVMTEMMEQVKILLESLITDEKFLEFFWKLKFDFNHNQDQKTVSVAITADEGLFGLLSESLLKFSELYLSEEFTSFLEFEALLNLNFKDLLNKKDVKILEVLAKEGVLESNFTFRASQKLLKNIREYFANKLQAKIAVAPPAQKAKIVRIYTLLPLLLQSSKFVLKLNSFSDMKDLYPAYIPPNKLINSSAAIKDIIRGFKSPLEGLLQLPFIQELLEFGRTFLKCDFEFALLLPYLSASLNFTSEGLRETIDQILM